MKKIDTLKTVFTVALTITGALLWSQVVTNYNYTGAVQFYTVPAGITEIQIEAYGAKGGGTMGGNGGMATAIVPVTPGAVLEVYVGGMPASQMGPGGFNGGGAVLAQPCGGGNLDGFPGGGASDVRTSSSLFDRIIVAGGGGGQGYSSGAGGVGGGNTGGDGATSWIAGTNGKGGTQFAGGDGGIYGSGPWSPAPSGTFGVGGNSSPLDTYCTGSAGGGGWYGGGGGYVSAGGGGSSYISYPGSTVASTSSGVNNGHGYIIITQLCDALSVSVSSTTVCDGELVTLLVNSTNGGTISWDNGVTNGNPFVPASIGMTTYSATSTDPDDCDFTVDITNNPIPDVDGGDDIIICNDSTDTTLSAIGTADSYSWDNGITDGISFSPAIGTTIYTVTGTITVTGCENTDQVSVTVNLSPDISLSATDEMTGNDGTITLTINSGTPPYTFDWDNDGTGDFDDAQNLSALAPGTYTVVIMDTFGCSDTETITVDTQLGISTNQLDVLVYPNPAFDFITIKVEGNFNYILTDMSGKIIETGSSVDQKNISVTNLAAGLYLIEISANNLIHTIQISKK